MGTAEGIRRELMEQGRKALLFFMAWRDRSGSASPSRSRPNSTTASQSAPTTIAATIDVAIAFANEHRTHRRAGLGAVRHAPCFAPGFACPRAERRRARPTRRRNRSRCSVPIRMAASRLLQLDQRAEEILGMEEDDRLAVRADLRLGRRGRARPSARACGSPRRGRRPRSRDDGCRRPGCARGSAAIGECGAERLRSARSWCWAARRRRWSRRARAAAPRRRRSRRISSR